MNRYKCGGKMNRGGYIPSYGYGGQMLPQYGMGSWMDQSGYQNQMNYGQQQIPQYNAGTNMDATNAATSVASAIPIWGQVNALAQGAFAPIESKANAINSETGAFQNKNAAIGADVARNFLDPFTGAARTFKDENATNKEKFGAGLNMLLPGVGSLFSKGKKDRLERENMAALESANATNKSNEAMRQGQIDNYNSIMKRNSIRTQRLGSLNQQQSPQYSTNFAANGGFLQSYANGGPLFKPNRNNPQPYKTSDGNDYYVMNYNEAFANDPNVNDFAEGYSYTSDPNYAYKYGNMAPRIDTKDGTASFPSTYSGNTDAFKSAFMNKLSSKDLKNLPMVNKRRQSSNEFSNGGSVENLSKNQDVTYFANGGTHEQNPLGGIPIGEKGSVEEGELKANLKDGEYIFSNRF